MIRQAASKARITAQNVLQTRNARLASTTIGASLAPEKNPKNSILDSPAKESNMKEQTQQKKKTMAEFDEELRQKLEGISGGGGEAGLELENGQPVAMKRSVKENMFRLI